MPLTGQTPEERRLAGLQPLHRVDVGTTQDDDRLLCLELLIPGVLERRKHRRVGLGTVGELVQDENVAKAHVD